MQVTKNGVIKNRAMRNLKASEEKVDVSQSWWLRAKMCDEDAAALVRLLEQSEGYCI